MNKKIILIIVFIILIVVGVAIFLIKNDSNNTNNKSNNMQNIIEDNQETEQENSDDISKSTSKILVAYYSAQGHTEKVSKTIANKLGADIFEIIPVDVYTDEDLNWTNNNSRVTREHNDESLRNVELKKSKIDNIEEYDTIFIGYPIWWSIAAWPVDNFVKDNDFTGKTVIPFATSTSSGLGNSGKLLKEMSGTGNWNDGKRFSSNPNENEITKWLSDLGF